MRRLFQVLLMAVLHATPALLVPILPSSNWDPSISAYHFHVYFNHTNVDSVQEALQLRTHVQRNIERGILRNCRLNVVNFLPRGPHPLGNYETCCNASSIAEALSFFMEYRGDLSVLLHPLTRWELLDHTNRAMFLGPTVTLDPSKLSEDLHDDVDNCSHEEIDIVDTDILIN